MKLLLVSGSFPPMKCGVGDYSLQLAYALSEYVDEIAVLTDASVTLSVHEGRITLFPIVHGGKINIFRVFKVIRSWKPDIVHFQYPTKGYRNWYALPIILPILTWLLRIPIVMTWHERHLMTKNTWINFGMYIVFAMIICALTFVRPNFMELLPKSFHYLIRKKVTRFIPNASAIPVKKLGKQDQNTIKKRFNSENKSLVVFFGFAYPNKKVELVFQAADPTRDHIVLLCDLDPSFPYHRSILHIANSQEWKGNVSITGFLPPESVAEILAAADAVMLPFANGGGVWNSSVHAVSDQGTFLITTSLEIHGYVASENIYYARPGHLVDMRNALTRYSGLKNKENSEMQKSHWKKIAAEHVNIYKSFVTVGKG